MFNGNSLTLAVLADGVVELCFDRRGEAINKFDEQTTAELQVAVSLLVQWPQLRGVLVTSAKDSFIVGADIGEFDQRFRAPEHELARSLWQSNETFMSFEDLPVPSVAAINGHALGGGCELALTAAFRVMAQDALIGVPEVKLGLFPGLGGTVRLPRVGGPAVAINWIVEGGQHSAQAALDAGIVDAVCAPAELRDTALGWLRRAVAGETDWRTRQATKRAAVPMPPAAHAALFSQAASAFAERPHADHQPAAAMTLSLMARTTLMPRDAAQWQECEAFAKVVRTQAGRALVQAFIDERSVSRISKTWARRAPAPLRVAVHGAPVEAAWQRAGDRLALVGVADADLVLVPAVGGAAQMREALASAQSLACKDAAIAWVNSEEWRGELGPDLPASQSLVGLQLHARACAAGLVEVVRTERTGDDAIARAVAFAVALKDMPIVVREGPGLLVERLLASASAARRRLLVDGVAERRVEFALQSFGWSLDRSGLTPPAPAAAPGKADTLALSGEGITERLLMPMIVAAVLVLEEGVVGSAAELDTAMRLGGGFPKHAGGPLQYADWLGLAHVVERLDALARCGATPCPTPAMREMARAGHRFHQKETSA